MLYLKEINAADAEKEYRFFQEVPPSNGFQNSYFGMTYADFVNQAIPECLDHAKGTGLREGYVPDTCFLLWDGGEIVGVFKLRHYLNDALRNGGGHIGYAVHPDKRGRGYGTKGLALALQEIVKLPDFEGGEVYLHCYLTNPASLRVMLKNGGYIHHQDESGYHVRIQVARP